MKEALDHIIFFRDLSPEQAEKLREVCASDPEAALAFRRWRMLREELRGRLDQSVPNAELFGLCVLYERGFEDVLTENERIRAERFMPEFRSSVERHPGLNGVARDAAAATRAFDAMWDAWFDPSAPELSGIEDSHDAPARRDSTAPAGDQPPAAPARRETAAGPRRPIPRPKSAARNRPIRWGTRIGIAAAVVAFAVILVFVARRDHGMITVETAEGETRVVELGGGSTARLLGASRLAYHPPEDLAPLGRQVLLEGRAFFEIVPDGHGLVLKTPNAQVTVLGTSFGVRSNADTTEVILAQGRLSLASRSEPRQVVVLESGQMSRVAGGARPSAPEEVRIHERLSWSGLFVFTSTPLDEILDELSRHYDVDLSAAPPGLAQERVTGRFEHAQALPEILRILAAAVGARVESTTDGYRLVGT